MKQFLSLIFICLLFKVQAQQPKVTQQALPQNTDWLVQPIKTPAEVLIINNKKDIVLFNGLVKRSFRITPNLACIGYENTSNGQELLRAVSPEAKIVINGISYNVGGLLGQKEKAYLLPEWVDNFTKEDSAFQYKSYQITDAKPYLNLSSTEKWWTPNQTSLKGKQINFLFESSLSELAGVIVKVHYEIYDGLPLISKWVTIENNGGKSIKLNKVVSEVLSAVEEESDVEKSERIRIPQGIYIENNYAFIRANEQSDSPVHWNTDKSYTSQVSYSLKTPCLLEVFPPRATGIDLKKGELFTSIRSNELLLDSYDKERRGLAVRKMYRALAPWATLNPIFMHLVSKTDAEVKTAIDQCAATGYEAVIVSFGSHLNMEDSSQKNIQRWKELAAYAHQKNIKIGCYSLFSSRKISDEDDVIDAVTGKPGGAYFGGHAPCFGSKWGLAYRDKIKYFFAQTDFDIWENDGPYPGDVCASTTHPGHVGLDDSQWKQAEIQKELYHWLNQRGVYINAPDWYFLDGTNKTALGYREMNFTLSREQQRILNRQNIYDGTWVKTPSMGWGFVPLTAYHNGKADAVLEPLNDHLEDYKQLMIQYYGAGVQACYRGPRLYDTDKTKATVQNVINWYKKYRDILNADIIHLRRADGRDWDGWMHVDPSLKQKALAMIFNPTKEKITRTIKIPLYYTGIQKKAILKFEDNTVLQKQLDDKKEIELTISINANSYSWFVVE